MNDVTHILNAAGQGEALAANELLSLVYEELRRVAAAKMAQEAPGQTLQPTALVHEAWLRLTGDKRRHWNDRTHFFASAAEAMRLILVDNARRKRAVRHGGGQHRVDMPELASAVVEHDDKVVAVDEALEKFAALDPQKADLVKLRYFVGMTVEEAADALGISERTAKRYWAFARAWLHEEIKAQQG
ncbi:MAG TPA: sigma-70 family RNA polymerase sigma factor [Candidatus Paceibacterota bacterium]|nr:sigma-70 family RNA polymerase sigma factor [Verrucomicrobiota bacterium]HOX03934.1 sigma-70 family RNA polymerase sigma factor [Verrucomicrobiota bacterium]HRZ46839.1 sigma-70 family RNA polymerase sigma factor [Candidatus Paceibacterota bacterium]